MIAPTVRDLFDIIVGCLETHGTTAAGRATVSGADFLERVERHAARGLPDEYADHLVEGSSRGWQNLPVIEEHYADWPAPWRRAENVHEEALRPTGRAVPISEALSLREGGGHATITGRVISLADGASRADVTVRVRDSSGEAALVCKSSPAGPVIRRCYEFDVAVTAGASQPAPPPEPNDPVERRFYTDFGLGGIDGVSEAPRPIGPADVL